MIKILLFIILLFLFPYWLVLGNVGVSNFGVFMILKCDMKTYQMEVMTK